jgi:hypothetical protein
MAPVQTPDQVEHRSAAASAVVWSNGREAIVATMSEDGQVFTCEINRGLSSEAAYLALVVRAVGDRTRVAILGPSSARLALEREYVAIYRRPERIVDVEPTGTVETEDLVERLRALAA